MKMIRPLLAALAFAAVAPTAATPAAAQTATCRPWCVHYSTSGGGGSNCGFISFEQCRQTAQGADICLPNGACLPQGDRRRR
jgi:hypothetical protein